MRTADDDLHDLHADHPDRMEGAAAARAADGPNRRDAQRTLGRLRLRDEPAIRATPRGAHPARDLDPVAELLAQISDRGRTPIARMLAAACGKLSSPS
jgi:hypothetical protein